MRCVIISGSPDTDVEFVKSVVANDDFVICADNGYRFAQLAGISPDVIVGDFDSFEGEVTDSCEIVTLNREKDYTDTIHSIDIALEKGYNDIVIVGALGGRFDHSFANLGALAFIADKGASGVLLSEKERVELLSAGERVFTDVKGKIFSVFPFGCDKACLTYKGAKYPLDRAYLENGKPKGVSNVFESDMCRITVHSGSVIVITNQNEKI